MHVKKHNLYTKHTIIKIVEFAEEYVRLFGARFLVLAAECAKQSQNVNFGSLLIRAFKNETLIGIVSVLVLGKSGVENRSHSCANSTVLYVICRIGPLGGLRWAPRPFLSSQGSGQSI